MKKEEEPDVGMAIAILACLGVGAWLLLALGIEALIRMFGG